MQCETHTRKDKNIIRIATEQLYAGNNQTLYITKHIT
jgi:hypothetical protein